MTQKEHSTGVVGFFDGLSDGLRETARFFTGADYTDQLIALGQRRGGIFTPKKRAFLASRPATLDVPVGDALVRADTITVSAGKSSVTYHRFIAAYIMGAGPEFAIWKEHFFSTIGKAFGYQDVELGVDRDFDRIFVVRTADPVGTRRAMTDPVRRAMLTSHRDSSLKADHRTVTLRYLYDRAANTHRFEQAIDLVGTIAAYGGDWFSQLRALPSAEYVPPAGLYGERRVPLVHVPIRQTQVGIFPTFSARQFAFTASARLERALAPTALDLTEQDGAESVSVDLVPLEVRGDLLAASPGHLEVGREFVQFTLTGRTDAARLLAGAKLVAAVARGGRSRGAFR